MKLFISYRRDDTRAIVGRIYDRLIKEFGRNNVFLDIDNIPAGVNFQKHLQGVLHQSNIVIVLIGHNWLRKKEDGTPLWDEDDFLYLEVKTALVNRLHIIPVLVDDTEMPNKSQLPQDLYDLPYLHAVNLSIGQRFHTDMSFLVKELKAKQGNSFPWRGSVIGLTLLVALAAGGKYAYDKFLNQQIENSKMDALKALAKLEVSKPSENKPVASTSTLSVSNETTAKEKPVKTEPVTEVKRLPFEPKMIKIPAGSFMMGCVDGRDNIGASCSNREKPAHKVKIKTFYLAETEVTKGQFSVFIKDSGYKTTAEKQGSCYSVDEKGDWGDIKGNSWKKLGFKQTDQHPVACVSWGDAQAYMQWLNKKTNKQYRLPSEAEWEYAARGGIDNTAYPWGNKMDQDYANISGKRAKDQWQYTAEVASFPPNKFGIYDMHGNVWEWVQDNWHGSYKGAPQDGSVWEGGTEGVVRGGSWFSFGRSVRSAYRFHGSADSRYYFIGFRLSLGH